MAILTTSGRAAIAKAIASQALHFAWGTGLDEWGELQPPEDVAATSLVAEVGRRTATSVQYVVPDLNGEVIVPVFNDTSGGSVERRFSFSDDPTQHLYMRFNFDFSDASASNIRELAIFVGTVTKPGLPSGQKYFLPQDIEDPGTMLAVENLREVIQRSPNSRQSFEFVLTV